MATHDDGEAYAHGDPPIDWVAVTDLADIIAAHRPDPDRLAGLDDLERTAAEQATGIRLLDVLYGPDLIVF